MIRESTVDHVDEERAMLHVVRVTLRPYSPAGGREDLVGRAPRSETVSGDQELVGRHHQKK